MAENRILLTGAENWLSVSVPTGQDPTLVACPACGQMAKVLPDEGDEKATGKVVLSCFHCGLLRKADAKARSFDATRPTDTYFGAALWMQTPCCGSVLWAFNGRHLRWLEEYAAAGIRLRRRDPDRGWANSSLASRLPSWIKSGKNRRAVEKALKILKSMGRFP